MGVSTSAYTTPAQSTTGSLKRTVSDTIRHLFPGNLLFALVSSGLLTGIDEVSAEKGLIRKRRVATPKYEAFTYTPLAIEFTVTGAVTGTGTSADPFVFSVTDATGLTLKMNLVDSTSRTVGRIQAISTNALSVVTTGDNAFATLAGRKLLSLAPAYEENSSSPYVLMKDYDHMYNFTQISRFAVEISRSAQGNPNYGGDYWKGLNKRSIYEGLRKVELGALFQDRPAGTAETTADSVLGAFRTTRGLVPWSGTAWTAGGSMTADRWITDLPQALDETVGMDTDLICLCGTRFHSEMLMWVQEKMMVAQADKDLKKFGVYANRFMSGKSPRGIKVMVHDAFDRGDLQKNAFFFAPEMTEFVHLRDDDFKTKNKIQNNDVDGMKNEILGEWGMHFTDGGAHALMVTDLY